MAFVRESKIYRDSVSFWLEENNAYEQNYFKTYMTEYDPFVPNKFWICMEIRLQKKILLKHRREVEWLRPEWLVRKPVQTVKKEHNTFFCIVNQCKICAKWREISLLKSDRKVSSSPFLKNESV